MIKYVLASPSYLLREGLKAITKENENISIIGEINNKLDFRTKLMSLQPDILVIDNDSGDFVDIDELRDIFKHSSRTKTLVISDYTNRDNALRIIDSGVLGHLTKECEKNEIVAALESVAKGEKFICSKILDVILEKKQAAAVNESGLSEREIEIIKLIAEKYSNQEISRVLFISIHTVYTHRKNIMKKLKLKSPVELILYAMDKGIITPYQN
ncbi:MAG: LuxR C-terminal-related transcriptional regulator [Ignavibacteriaceae bacterium]